MRRFIGVGVAAVALAGLLWYATSGRDDPAGPASRASSEVRPDGRAATGADDGLDDDEGPLGFEDIARGVPYGPDPGGGLPVPRDPDEAYRIAMGLEIREPRSDDLDEQGRQIQEQLRHVSESVELAVAAQRELAEDSPERSAEAAQRIVALYEHLALQLEESPVPPLLDSDGARRYREAMTRLAASRRAEAGIVSDQGL